LKLLLLLLLMLLLLLFAPEFRLTMYNVLALVLNVVNSFLPITPKPELEDPSENLKNE
jgi:hypothetical protein